MYEIINFYDQFNFHYSKNLCAVVSENKKNMLCKLSFQNKNTINLLNHEKILLDNEYEKFLIPLNFTFAHCFLDVLSTVFFINYFKKDAKIIFYGNHEVQGYDLTDIFNGKVTREIAYNQIDQNLYNNIKLCFDFIDQLKLFNIDFSYINFEKTFLLTKNIYMLEFDNNGCVFVFKTKISVDVFNIYTKMLKTNNIINKKNINDKKIYLSRSNKKPKTLTFHNKNLDSYASPTIIPRINPVSNSRLLNEKTLEDFLIKNFDFEIIDESNFNSLSEQIEYINNASIIMSQSGSALANMIFMNNNNTVIELFTPLNVTNSIEEYHDHWLGLAKLFGHNYISIPHNKNGIEIIDQIQDNKYLYNMLKN